MFIKKKKVIPMSVRYADQQRSLNWNEAVAEAAKHAAADGRFEETRCLQIDRRCFLTGKKLFFKKAVRMTWTMHGPGLGLDASVYMDHEIWICQREYLLLALRY